ncbi:MAG: hypothetical protein ACJ74G_11580 [Blastocatellia bacterium]
MSKRGTLFVRIVEERQWQPAVWDPHRYQSAKASLLFGDYVEVRGLRRSASDSFSPFRPIEYGDISGGDYLTFKLEEANQQEAIHVAPSRFCRIGERALLMGTMRAYLGNIIVTPRAAWLGRRGPLSFAVKSEFVQLVPRDGMVYFWWAIVRSAVFLANLPTGSGGTRPRLQPEALAATPVRVPELEQRAAINEQLEKSAAREWREWRQRRAILDLLR